jgi:hypothetical protein
VKPKVDAPRVIAGGALSVIGLALVYAVLTGGPAGDPWTSAAVLVQRPFTEDRLSRERFQEYTGVVLPSSAEGFRSFVLHSSGWRDVWGHWVMPRAELLDLVAASDLVAQEIARTSGQDVGYLQGHVDWWRPGQNPLISRLGSRRPVIGGVLEMVVEQGPDVRVVLVFLYSARR